MSPVTRSQYLSDSMRVSDKEAQDADNINNKI
jgi:hypothetical protein